MEEIDLMHLSRQTYPSLVMTPHSPWYKKSLLPLPPPPHKHPAPLIFNSLGLIYLPGPVAIQRRVLRRSFGFCWDSLRSVRRYPLGVAAAARSAGVHRSPPSIFWCR
ncbi:hypothetical protein GDO81_018428 [Engystomops pustulosus]|uniref:Uncharacterized protein n=1 Tax=Engystomops pustulosus TaxID=76066 RepID=A0AAV6ZRL8_ENGPU|nr:hypothetical protein GDO81_018428 [Engystomops pustulosus]